MGSVNCFGKNIHICIAQKDESDNKEIKTTINKENVDKKKVSQNPNIFEKNNNNREPNKDENNGKKFLTQIENQKGENEPKFIHDFSSKNEEKINNNYPQTNEEQKFNHLPIKNFKQVIKVSPSKNYDQITNASSPKHEEQINYFPSLQKEDEIKNFDSQNVNQINNLFPLQNEDSNIELSSKNKNPIYNTSQINENEYLKNNKIITTINNEQITFVQNVSPFEVNPQKINQQKEVPVIHSFNEEEKIFESPFVPNKKEEDSIKENLPISQNEFIINNDNLIQFSNDILNKEKNLEQKLNEETNSNEIYYTNSTMINPSSQASHDNKEIKVDDNIVNLINDKIDLGKSIENTPNQEKNEEKEEYNKNNEIRNDSPKILYNNDNYSNIINYDDEPQKENANKNEDEMASIDNKNNEIEINQGNPEINNSQNINLIDFHQHHESTINNNSIINNPEDNDIKNLQEFDMKEFNNLNQLNVNSINEENKNLNLDDEQLKFLSNNDNEGKKSILNSENLKETTTRSPLIDENNELNNLKKDSILSKNGKIFNINDPQQSLDFININNLRQTPNTTSNEPPEKDLTGFYNLSTSRINNLNNKNIETNSNQIQNVALKQTKTFNEKTGNNSANLEMKMHHETTLNNDEINNYYQANTSTANEPVNININDLPININTTTENVIKEKEENNNQMTSSIDINNLKQLTISTSTTNIPKDKKFQYNNYKISASPQKCRIINFDDLLKLGYKKINFYNCRINSV